MDGPLQNNMLLSCSVFPYLGTSTAGDTFLCTRIRLDISTFYVTGLPAFLQSFTLVTFDFYVSKENKEIQCVPPFYLG